MVNGTNTDRVRRENSERLKERSQSGTVRTASAAHTPKKAVRPPSGAGRSASSSAAARKRRLSKKKKRQRRILLFAVLFLLFAIAVLVGSILLATRAAKSGSCSGTAVPASTPEPEGTPIPVTDATVIGSDVTVNGMRLVGKTVAEAQEILGFSSYAYFFRTFQKITGISPSKYRKLHKSQAIAALQPR